ncbi:phosphate ABC transporter substrate-binding protein PstS family protein [Cohnella sp. CFH 77786]|uniref:phosphate ABC transporter substrate-binding protein PstS family protein n=1 Tax=Cohnella sp. CFH 77786 TaxID=2662265 RepID=UPI001C60A5E0|nr:phosphate ABC transporter substrate-binding protein PstS family protein [Cohnella sp. CFH 77786]MBW5449112.1 phosphate ABC transporter substrate-binding protein PstS family protein [Cohnella sp. CFH 77786]
MKKSLVLVLTLIVALTLAACGKSNNEGTASSPSASASESAPASSAAGEALSGTILAAGSTALQPLVEQVATKFMADSKYSGISVTVQGGGSGGGLTQVQAGQVDIGNSDIFAEEKFKDADADKAKELVDHQVAVVAIATVANPKVGVDNLTKQQLVDIFSGKVKNWKEVGGADQKIVIVNRPSSSGTRKTFENLALGGPSQDLPGSIQEDSSGTVKKLVGETPGAIGYLALSYLDDSVKALKYEGADASVENVTTGKYPVWAYEHMYTKGEPTPVVKALIDYILSDEIQKSDVTEMGYIPIGDMKVARDVNGNVTNK